MDPPPFHHHTNQKSRYVNVLSPPNFMPPFHQRNRPPPPPPHHLLPPLPPHHIPHNPLPPPSPSHFRLSHPHPPEHRSIKENLHRYEFDRSYSPTPLPPPPPLARWTELLPPAPPIAPEHIQFRPVDNYPDRNPMFKDALFLDEIRNRYGDSSINDIPDTWGQGLLRGGRRIEDTHFGRGHIERHRQQFGSQSEKNFNIEPLRAHDSYNYRDEDNRRWDYNVNDRDSYHLQYKEPATGDHSLARFRGRLGRGGRVKEFVRSPRNKQVQKKSALLRIQLGKTSNRNRGGHEYHHFPKEPSSNGLRGKEKEAFVPSQRKSEGETDRDRSPVELDVSFKSNALVAKAIVTSSSPGLDSDRILTPRNSNIKKVSISGSPSTRLNSITPQELDFQYDSEKAPKESKEEIAVSRSENTNDTCASYLGDSNADNGSPKAIGSDVGGNGIGSDETSIRRVRKKRKVNRQLVCESSLQLTKDGCEIYNANTQANSPAAFSQLGKGTTVSERRKAASGSDTVPDVLLQASSNELDISKAQEQLESIFSGKDVRDIDCSIHFGPDSDPKRIISPKFFDSAGFSGDASTERINHAGQLLVPEDADHAFIMGINEDTIPADRMVTNENAAYANTLDSNERIDNVDKLVQTVADLGTSEVDSKQFNSSGTEINSASEQQPFEDSVILPLDGHMRGVSELRVLVEDHDTSGFSRPKETRIHEIIQGDESEMHGLYSSSNAESEMFKRAEMVTLCNFGFTDVGSAEYFPDQVDMVQDGQKEQSKVCSSLLAEDTRVTVSDAIADNSNLSSVITSSTIFLSTDCPGVALSDISRRKAICGKSCKDIPTGSLEHNLVAFSSISHSPNFKRKRNAGDAPNEPKTSEERIDVVGSVGDEEKGFVEDLIFTEEDVPCDRDNGKNGNDSCPGNPKKRKVVSPRFSHFSLSEFCEGSEAADSGSLTAEVLMDINRSKVQSECSVMPPVIDSPSVCLSPCVTQIATSFPAESIGCNRRTQCSKLDGNSQSLQVKGIDGKEDNPTVEAEATSRQDTACTGSKISGGVFDASDVNKTPGDDDGSSENYLIANDDSAFLPNNSSLLADGNDISATSSGDELMDSGPDLPSHMYPTKDMHSDPGSNLLKNTQASPIQLTNETVGMNDHISTEKVVAAYPMPVLPKTSPKKSSAYQFATTSQTSQSLSQNTSKSKQNINPVCGISYLSKNQPTSTVPSVFPGNPALSLNRLKRVIPSAHVTKSRTWHRTGNSSVTVARPKLQSFHVPQSHVHKTVGNIQSSYVRKGNSLVRKPSLSDISHGFHSSSSSVYRLSPSHVDSSKNQISANNTEAVNPPSVCRTGVNTPSGRSESLTHNGELLNCTALNLGESMSLPLLIPPSNNFPATNSDPSDSTSKSSIRECQTGSGNNSDSQSTLDEGNSGKKITYIKQKSYQLIAASDSEDPAPQSAGKTKLASSSDGYYKRRTNQLIRASLENHLKKDALADGSFGTYKPRSRRVTQSRSAREQQSGFSKTRKTSKFSLVWKLCDTQSSAKDSKSLRRQRVRPYLFPWKRSTYWRNVNLGSQNGSPQSMISRKLLLSRKRGAIYTRSTHGFSLRISKVLSVGGSSLKWSKSIERNSKKVNEEATRAVAAAEQRKKEQNVPTVLKNRNHVLRKSVLSVKLRPGERIFRIGSERYKMDSTGKTLQRITDEPSHSAVQKPGKKIKNSYVPRRLLIGNEEYVRIGNGNQLVRNPKKRTRILASERVRWSLHTARLRLARKRKYCQFFTRFGRCNKDDGKCPYIHDPSKIVVCTKFLKGSCSNTECKLTHEVIPERMQDCSYFLQGICSNENCPYRHVNVNPNSSLCESFLRGYCADGNECRRKHTYVCPAFEANGICPEGSKCKLHHPKRKRVMKRKSLSEQKNILGRYFDSGPFDVAESRAAIIERLPAEGNDVVQEEGMLGDYISLDVDEELEHTVAPVHRERNERPLEDQLDLDDLIKPIGIMNRNRTVHKSPDI